MQPLATEVQMALYKNSIGIQHLKQTHSKESMIIKKERGRYSELDRYIKIREKLNRAVLGTYKNESNANDFIKILANVDVKEYTHEQLKVI